MRCTPSPGSCGQPRSRSLTSLKAIVDDYSARFRVREWVVFHQLHRSVAEALEVVASFRDSDGKVYSHQRRVPKAAKAKAADAIRALDLAGVGDFEDLYQRVARAIGAINGIGDLTVYDIAVRLGASLRVMPDRVYVQAGVRHGARALGLDATQRSLPVDAFPLELQRLEPWKVEDLLCIYKHELGRLRRAA